MIFAAGLGTRLKPITDTIPKALLPIGGKTLLEWQLDKLREAGITDVVINIHHFADKIRAFVAEHEGFDMNIRFSDETEMLLETGGGLKKAASLFTPGEDVLVCNVDVLSNICIPDLVAAHRSDALSTIVVSRRQTQRYFVFRDGSLAGWTNISTGEKKPASLSLEGTELLAFSGMHIISHRIFSLMADYPDKFSITDFYIQQCASHRIDAYIPQNYRMMDIGKIDHLQEAEEFALSL